MKLLLVLLLGLVSSQAYLNNIPITFSLKGDVSYTPSTGGVAIPGYIMEVGFDRYSWLGVQLMTVTSSSKYDILVLHRSTTPASGSYSCTITDHYVSTGRPDTLQNDGITNMDKSVITYSESSKFSLELYRTKGDTIGQDWQGGDFVQVCFFTSSSTFSTSTWLSNIKACFGYQVGTSYLSTFRGVSLGSMYFEGVSSYVYGGVLGPVEEVMLFWYRPSSVVSNTSQIILQIGDKISDNVGYDYYKCGVGDFYGSSSSSLTQDLIFSGYNDGSCSYYETASSVMLAYSRKKATSDAFDASIGSSLKVCVIGSTSHCSTFGGLSKLYPVMSISSALSIYESYLLISLGILFLLGLY